MVRHLCGICLLPLQRSDCCRRVLVLGVGRCCFRPRVFNKFSHFWQNKSFFLGATTNNFSQVCTRRRGSCPQCVLLCCRICAFRATQPAAPKAGAARTRGAARSRVGPPESVAPAAPSDPESGDEAPTLMEWSAMVVPTYPEGGSHALKVCQHHHQVVRVGHGVGLSETQRTRCARLHRPIPFG